MSKILLIDDNEAYCEQIQKSLELKNFSIEFETDAHQGLKRALEEDWDVVLVDMVLGPQTDGLALLKEIKKQKSELPVILISGSSVLDSIADSINAGAFDYLEKPIDLERLIISLKHALQLRTVSRLNQRLIKELQQSLSSFGLGSALKEALHLLSRASANTERLLITGERGTGKELLARLIHYYSDRKFAPFVTYNCQAPQPNSLQEMERQCHQLFTEAHGGTLFLREVDRLPDFAQKQLMTKLHQNFFQAPVNSPTPSGNVRFIASSSRDLKTLVEQGVFLPELFNLLANFTVKIPPLRARVQDIPLLTEHFIHIESQNQGTPINRIEPAVLEQLKKHSWPENISELKFVTRFMVWFQEDGYITEQTAKLALNTYRLLSDLRQKNLRNKIAPLLEELTETALMKE